MDMKILFCGFQHGHILGLYNSVKNRDDVEIVACVEKDANKKDELSKSMGIVFDERDYDFWLTQDVDIVAIGSEYGVRGELAIKALKAGKHIISDKPVCTRREELDEITRLTKEKGLKLACMLDLRYMPSSITAKRILDSGRLGKVHNVTFTGQHCLGYGTRPSWYFAEGMHGGTVNDLAIHGVDLVRHLTGLAIEKVNAVRTWNSYAYKTPDFKDCAMFMAQLTGGVGLLADVSYSAPSQVFSMPTYWDFKIWCDKGLLNFCATKDDVLIYEEGNPETQVEKGATDVGDYLTDLIHEIKTGGNAFTDSVLFSTSSTLAVQELADKE